MSDTAIRLMATFLEEMDERLDTFVREVLELEGPLSEAERTRRIAGLFRGAHSLKGAANAVGVASIAAVCHAIEDLLSALEQGRLEFGAPLAETLFETADGLRIAGFRLRAGEDPSPELAAYLPRLAAFAPEENAPRSSPVNPMRSELPAPVVSATLEGTVRVAAEKLDALLLQSGELLVANYHATARLGEVAALGEAVRRLRSEPMFRDDGKGRTLRGSTRLRELDTVLDRLRQAIVRDHERLQRAASQVDAQVRRVRMVPLRTACEGLERVTRDAARISNKNAQLRLQGVELELDRSIVEGVRDSLAHLVRNAVDHGIEAPERRRASGKPETGTVSISAALRGTGIEIVVADDGGGLDLVRLAENARARGFAVSDDETSESAFLPGVSTAASITELSGRGVGLDAVRTALEAVRGSVAVSSSSGRGTRFVLTLPLTLTTLRVILFELAGQTFALDSSAVQRVARVGAADVALVEGRPTIVGSGPPIPFVSFRAIFDFPVCESVLACYPVIMLRLGEGAIALRVDALLDEREIVVRSLGPRLAGAPAIAGAVVLPDGSLALVARVGFVLEKAVQLTRVQRVTHALPVERRRKTILLVDDSITTRTLERGILEAADYDVVTAGDGETAWDLLQEAHVDLVVSDVDMPRMDGFMLVRAMRSSDRFRDVPTILVTARENDADKRRGVEVGADAYVIKSGFDAEALLEIIGHLIR